MKSKVHFHEVQQANHKLQPWQIFLTTLSYLNPIHQVVKYLLIYSLLICENHNACIHARPLYIFIRVSLLNLNKTSMSSGYRTSHQFIFKSSHFLRVRLRIGLLEPCNNQPLMENHLVRTLDVSSKIDNFVLNPRDHQQVNGET